MKAAAIYARVSTGDQVRGTSLDGQVTICREYAEKQGYTVVEAGVVTEDISGTVLDRPGLSKLMAMAQRKEIDAVVLAKVDRLARGRVVDALLETDLRTLGVDVLYVNRETATPEGRLLVNIEKDFAEWERERIMERTWGGKVNRAKEGKVMGSWSVPYGYNLIRGEGRYEILESEAQWVRQMFDWLVNERCTLRQIMKRLNDLGVPTKQGRRFWYAGTVQKILGNSMYAGDWYWNKTQQVEPKKPHKAERTAAKSSHLVKPREDWIHIPVDPIVSREMYEASARQLERNKEKAGRRGTRNDLLKRLLVCSFCGRRLSCYPVRRKQTAGTFGTQYICSGHVTASLKATCRCPYLTGHNVERDLWARLTDYLTNEDLILGTLRKRDANRGEEKARDQAQLASLCEAQEAAKRERNKLLDLHLAEPPLIDRETFQERTLLLDKRTRELQAARGEVEERMRQRDGHAASEEHIRAVCALAKEGLPYFTEEDKREFLEALELRGVVYTNRIEFTWLLSEPITLLLGKAAERETQEMYNSSEHAIQFRQVQGLVSIPLAFELAVGAA